MEQMLIKLMANSIEDNYNKLSMINDLNTTINGQPFLDWDENVTNFTNIVPIVIELNYPIEILQVIVNHDYFFNPLLNKSNPYITNMYQSLNATELNCLHQISQHMHRENVHPIQV